jgi:adenylate cyclase
VPDVFISYARSSENQAKEFAEALRALGYGVWRDDELPAHRTYAEVIEDRLRAAKAVVVMWSDDAVKSQWVRAEADVAREAGTLVQLSLDGSAPPLPFNQIQFADLRGWPAGPDHPGWKKVQASICELVAREVFGSDGARPSAPQQPATTKPSIAVLPFANLSTDPEQEFLVDGMVEEIVGALSRYRSLFVIGAGSGLSFKGQAVSPQEAGRRLGARYVLDGAVYKSGNRVRISVKLTDVAEGVQIWANRFDDTLEDVFALQDKVALSVAGVIEPTVQAAEGRKVSARSTTDMTSYELYLRGWKLAWNLDRTEVHEGLDLLTQAVERDPNHARALAATAACHGEVFSFSWSDDVERHRRLGLDLSHRALKLAPGDPEVLAWCGFTLFCMRDDLRAASGLIDRALALNPSLAFAWLCSGHLRARLGQSDQAAEHFETALRLDPLSALRHWALTGLATVRMMQGRLPEAVDLLRESAQLCASSPMNHILLAACFGYLGQIDEAGEALARFEALSGLPAERWIHLTGWGDAVEAGIALALGRRPKGD